MYLQGTDDAYLLKLTGPLGITRAEEAVKRFRQLSKQGIKKVVVNLENVPFIDSRGLAALIAGYKMFGSQALNFRLEGLQDQPRLLFELTMFDHIFQIDQPA